MVFFLVSEKTGFFQFPRSRVKSCDGSPISLFSSLYRYFCTPHVVEVQCEPRENVRWTQGKRDWEVTGRSEKGEGLWKMWSGRMRCQKKAWRSDMKKASRVLSLTQQLMYMLETHASHSHIRVFTARIQHNVSIHSTWLCCLPYATLALSFASLP